MRPAAARPLDVWDFTPGTQGTVFLNFQQLLIWMIVSPPGECFMNYHNCVVCCRFSLHIRHYICVITWYGKIASWISTQNDRQLISLKNATIGLCVQAYYSNRGMHGHCVSLELPFNEWWFGEIFLSIIIHVETDFVDPTYYVIPWVDRQRVRLVSGHKV